MASNSIFVILFIFLLPNQNHAQIRPEHDFSKFSENFNEMSPDNEYIILDYSNDRSRLTISSRIASYYLSEDLHDNEICYPAGIYKFENFHFLRIQKIIFARPKVIEEYLISVTKRGKIIDRVLCGSYSANAVSTYRIESKIMNDKLITTYTVYKHQSNTGQNNKDTFKTITYNINETGEFIKIKN